VTRFKTISLVLALFPALPAAVGCGHATYPGTTLSLLNSTDEDVCSVYLSPYSGEWGDDRLDPEDRIARSEFRTFELRPGTWHIRTDNCAGDMVFTRHDLLVRGHVMVRARPVKTSAHRRYGHKLAGGCGPTRSF
jgi:hypothetical protein